MSDNLDDPPNSVDGQDEHPKKKVRRAGQACDRCRSRKIKCDGKLPSCSPCEAAKVQCKTTDRTSNRTVPRGYLEALEARLSEQSRLQARIHELESKLREVDPSAQILNKSITSSQFLTPPDTSNNTNNQNHSSNVTPKLESPYSQSHSPPYLPYGDERFPDFHGHNSSLQNDQDANADAGLFETGEAGKGWYLGSASGMIYMNSIKNTASSVLGIDLDLSDFSPLSKSVSGKSVPSLFSELHSHRARKPVKPIFPPKDLGFELVNDFFATINLLCPLLHKPSFYRQLNLIYDDPTYTPETAFIIEYNMIMAIAARVRPQSRYHYPGVAPSHYPVASAPSKHSSMLAEIATKAPCPIPHDQFYKRILPYFPDLLNEPELADLQALLLLMIYLIGVYKMGHLWHLSRVVSAIALELGLHRSDANWSNFNPLEREMRKRVYVLTVGLDLKISNSLGRPPSFRLQDSDVSLPAYMDDEYINEGGAMPMPEGHIPQLAPAVQLAMLIRINCAVSERLFCVAKGRGQRGRYVDAVSALEKELKDWKDRLPDYINFDPSGAPDQSPFWIANAGLFLMYNEMRLLIRHPSMGRLSPSPAFFAESLAICAEASRNILAIINRFRDFRQLECHPQSVSTIVLASLTILYSLWEKKNETTKQEIEREMELPLDILGEIGQTYGPTKRLHQALATLVAATIENLERSRNGSKVQTFSFGSPPRGPIAPPMQLPLRIDPSLQLEAENRSNHHHTPISSQAPISPNLSKNPANSAPVPSLRWHDPVNGQAPLPSETQLPSPSMQTISTTNPGASVIPPESVQQEPPSDVIDETMLWGQQLDWTGGWDDFLNAIAM